MGSLFLSSYSKKVDAMDGQTPLPFQMSARDSKSSSKRIMIRATVSDSDCETTMTSLRFLREVSAADENGITEAYNSDHYHRSWKSTILTSYPGCLLSY